MIGILVEFEDLVWVLLFMETAFFLRGGEVAFTAECSALSD